MSLLKENPGRIFNLDMIGIGSVIYAKHMSWLTGKTGIVTEADEYKIKVQFVPGISNAVNYFIIESHSADQGEWIIRWSNDVETIYQFGEGDYD